jgi:D-tyrosyl-tRNA(Tyr) deacylase
MRALVQRVKRARVDVDGQAVGEIGPGLLTLLGIAPTDTAETVERAIQKILKLRIFEDEASKMNRSLLDTGGGHLIVSQFTLYGDASEGNRPSFTAAARPELAEPLYRLSLERSRALGCARTEGGRFGAHMEVSLLNDGPVTLWLEFP